MSLIYEDDQNAIASESRRALASRTLERQLPLLDAGGDYDRGFWELARMQGWTALAVPEAHGGIGLGLVELGIVALEAGRVLSGAPFITGGYGVTRALVALADAETQATWLPRLAAGDAIGAIAFAEGADALPAMAGPVIAGGRVKGVKPAVSGGLHADLAIVLAQEDGAAALALVDLTGVERRVLRTFDDSRGTADLLLHDAPAKVLARGAAARAAALDILAHQAVVTAQEQTGGAEILMETARDYALTRRAFGQPIGGFQSVKHRIAELYALVELARANAIHAASRGGQRDFVAAAAAARLSATEAYDTAARDCIQIHGGIGVTWEAGLHLHQRRARTLAVEQGNMMFWEDVLVDTLETAA